MRRPPLTSATAAWMLSFLPTQASTGSLARLCPPSLPPFTLTVSSVWTLKSSRPIWYPTSTSTFTRWPIHPVSQLRSCHKQLSVALECLPEHPQGLSAKKETVSNSIHLSKSIYFCFIDYAEAFDCLHHNKLWKILKDMGIPDHLTCLLRNLYAGQEATVRTGHETTDWFQIGKGVCQGCILSPCLLYLYAESIMRNAGLKATQAGIKIAGRNINNLRYADDTTLMADTKVKRNSKASWWKWKRRVKRLA